MASNMFGVEIDAKAAIHEVGDEGACEVIPRHSNQNGEPIYN
ncbi:hypothetical protein [Bradyrhizobium brasilense]|uniref:Uncharacterized protein n=1 Tax=Bradyrhizobium brasilense TaxID=1419277 RepID=A0ABY8J9T9_9BRAD|nr:hypothetical protein [Bradyrhizobium brasilense]WFU62335.1 hypothetical protein QA636_33295 [Bradyrhizobium brasilense]